MNPAAIEVADAPGQLLERPPPSPRPLERHGKRVRVSGRGEVSRVAQRVAESPRRAKRARSTFNNSKIARAGGVVAKASGERERVEMADRDR
jgi:hypothetical protein